MLSIRCKSQESTSGTLVAVDSYRLDLDVDSYATMPLHSHHIQSSRFAWIFRLQEKLLTKILSDNPEYWDAMRIRTREVIQSKDGGVLDITMDELSAELLQTGKAVVPGELKEEFMAEIQNSMERLAKRKR